MLRLATPLPTETVLGPAVGRTTLTLPALLPKDRLSEAAMDAPWVIVEAFALLAPVSVLLVTRETQLRAVTRRRAQRARSSVEDTMIGIRSTALVMGLCGAGCVALLAATLREVGASAARVWAALLLFAVSPLVLGSLFDTRFDLWPALLALAGVAALVRERPLLAGAFLGLGFAAKLWPGILLPLAVVHLWRRRGTGSAGAAVAAFAAVAAACFIPFAILEPHGLWSSISGQFDRPLQIESLGSAVLLAAEHLGIATYTTIA